MKLSTIKVSVLLYSFLFTISTKTFSQYTTNYTPIVSSGPLPQEFIQTARSISENEVKSVAAGKDKIAKQQFIIENNYFIRDLLLSGDVLVNDPLSKYVNKVADELLKEQPALRQKLHIYVTKSSDVNAYAFDKGYIFINLGLLAQLENEAQLAFVLAHEITHIIKKHSVNQYIEEIRLDRGTNSYEIGSDEAKSLAKYRFSKEQESEADIAGLKLIKETKYSIKALNGAFDVLQYSYLPFELIEFKKSFFEDKNLIIPDTLNLKKVSDIKSNDDYDDSKSTHPNIRKRRGAIEPDLSVSDESSRKKYLVSEAEFKNVREISRFELCKQYLLERDYVNAIYASYILLEKYPENLFLKKTVAKGLYNILVNKTNHKKGTGTVYVIDDNNLSTHRYSIPDYEKIEGASQRLYYMLENLTSAELNTLALSYTFKAHKQYPKDKILTSLTDSLFSELVNANSLFLNDFSKKSKTDIKNADTVKIKEDIEPEESSKYSQIKKQQQQVEVQTEENFVKYAFVDLLKDEEFVSSYSRMAKGLTHKPVVEEEFVNSEKKKKAAKKKSGNEQLLGIDKVAFITPFYMKVKNDHGDDFVNFYDSEDKQAMLSKIQEDCADRLKLQYVHNSIKDLTADDIKRYNANALLNEWLGERFKHGDNNDEIVTSSEYITELIQELGTKYIAWSGVYTRKGKRSRTTYFFIVVDIESGKIMKFENRFVKSKDNKDLINSFVYNSLMHVVKKPKL